MKRHYSKIQVKKDPISWKVLALPRQSIGNGSCEQRVASHKVIELSVAVTATTFQVINSYAVFVLDTCFKMTLIQLKLVETADTWLHGENQIALSNQNRHLLECAVWSKSTRLSYILDCKTTNKQCNMGRMIPITRQSHYALLIISLSISSQWAENKRHGQVDYRWLLLWVSTLNTLEVKKQAQHLTVITRVTRSIDSAFKKTS